MFSAFLDLYQCHEACCTCSVHFHQVRKTIDPVRSYSMSEPLTFELKLVSELHVTAAGILSTLVLFFLELGQALRQSALDRYSDRKPWNNAAS